MKLIRLVLGKMIIFFDRTFAPTPVTRSVLDQKKIDESLSAYALFQFEACPFCVKVRRNLRRLNLKMKMFDVLNDKKAEQELIAGGGKRQVPCLKISKSDGSVQWMYESGDINNYLNAQFGS